MFVVHFYLSYVVSAHHHITHIIPGIFHRIFMHLSLLEATIMAELTPILLRVTSTAWQRAHLWLGIYHLLPHTPLEL
jgi:hypothetical protein